MGSFVYFCFACHAQLALSRVGWSALFEKPADFQAFENVLSETRDAFPMRICAYCLMPNHWHMLLWPEHDGDLAAFIQRLSITHVRCWQEHRRFVGLGHVYQGRYKIKKVPDTFLLAPSEVRMITMRFYYRRNLKSLTIDVESFSKAIELLHYVVHDMLSRNTVGCAIEIMDLRDTEFPAVYFQQCDGGYFLQMFASERLSVDGQEGWHCLVGANQEKSSATDLVRVNYDKKEVQDYFPARCAEGVFFSDELLVSIETLEALLSRYPGEESLREWISTENWINLGLL